MAKYLVSFLLAGLLGCSAPYEIDRDIEPPVLLSYAPLPPYPHAPLDRTLKLRVMVCVTKEGTVEQVRLLSSSGDENWDSLAEKSIRQWRYAPPRRGGEPADIWVQQRIVVQFEELIHMSVAELSVSNRSLADSLYSLLQTGAGFESLVRQFSDSPSRANNGLLGTIDIRTYPRDIRESLRRLNIGGITRPLRADGNFVIYRRVKD